MKLSVIRFIVFLFFLGVFSISCTSKSSKQNDLSGYVDPFIGTGEHGHTYPGATMPFGMVHLSPDTRMENWDGCSGYHYSDRTILGFSHIHLSGTGSPEFCDILFMPTNGKLQLLPGEEEDSETGYRSCFKHENEEAEPGYYKVKLDDYAITAELTVTPRTGMHAYTFPESTESNIIIDLKHRGEVIHSGIQIVNDSVIVGSRRSKGWCADQYVYFYAKFSKPFLKSGIALDDQILEGIKEAEGKNVKAFVRFDTRDKEQVFIKVGISAVSIDGARLNLETENQGWDFQSVRETARADWNKQFAKIEVEGGTESDKTIFYTSMYHASLAPNLFMDVDGKFRGVDKKVHQSDEFVNHTIYSLWDVFRTQLPLFTIIEPSRTNEIIRGALKMYQLGGHLPRWEINGHLSNNMIGFHSLPMILDAYNKGINSYDLDLAYEAMKNEMEEIPYFNDLGFIPADIEGRGGSVALMMEYAYNAWCLSEMAGIMGKHEDQILYQQRARFYKNVFDSSRGFMRPKNTDYSWVEPFDPAEPSGHYVEGNAFQYSAFIPHDVNEFIRLLGGDKACNDWLDTLFTHTSEYDKNVVDASGLIGQYAHGNEPSHQIAYMYNYTGEAPKTQKYVREILSSLYSEHPEGLSGNEDCGQMSAWYIMSAMGFYPVCPGDARYNIGSPLFDKVSINLENGKSFQIRTKKGSPENIYIQSATLNGKPYTKSWFHHKEILEGGEFVFEMGNKPNYKWGVFAADRPTTKDLPDAVSVPSYKMAENYFFDRATISLSCETDRAEIYYTTDGSEPNENGIQYNGPFTVDETTNLKFYATIEGMHPSTTVNTTLEKLSGIEVVKFKNYNGLNLSPGLNYKYYEEDVLAVDELDDFQPQKTGVCPNFSIAERDNDGLFAFAYEGYIKIPRDGVYTFFLSSNDGAVLYLNGERFIDKDGPGTATPLSRMVKLKTGTYKIGEKYFQMGGGFSNEISWKGPGISKAVIPGSVLFH